MLFRSFRRLGALAIGSVAFWEPITSAAAQMSVVEAMPGYAHWNVHSAQDLVAEIDGAKDEGLRPEDYGIAALKRAVEQGEGAALDTLATASALALAHDYYLGRISDRSSMQWMIERSPHETAQLSARLQAAVDNGKVHDFFQVLLPLDPRYAALRNAYVQAKPGILRDKFRVNLERWRWMPRSVAADYLYVNVPSYTLHVVRDGLPLSSYDVVVGAKDTPTPQIVSQTGSFVVNPAWYVPASIVKKSGLKAGRGGYVGRRLADGTLVIMQPPGPNNALGRIKLNLDNDQAIYLHDTNVKAVFLRSNRALSHGCIRVKDIDQLVFELMGQDGNSTALQAALMGTATETLQLPRTWPVYILYFTADVDETGSLITYPDPYGYDAKILAALDGRTVEIASK